MDSNKNYFQPQQKEKETNVQKNFIDIRNLNGYCSSDFNNEEKFKNFVSEKDLDEYIKANLNLMDKSKLPIGNKNTFSKYSQLVLELRLNVDCDNSIYTDNYEFNLSLSVKCDIDSLLKSNHDIEKWINKINNIKKMTENGNFSKFSPDIILKRVNKLNINNLPDDIVYKGNFFENETKITGNLNVNILVECKTNLKINF